MAVNALDKLIDEWKSKCDTGVIMDLRKGKDSVPDVERVPVDSPNIGSLFGQGGVPIGRIVEIFGPESGGKSSLCEYVAGQFQKTDMMIVDKKTGDFVTDKNGEIQTRKGVVLYIDAEHAIDLNYAKIHGFDVNSSILVQPDSGEQALDIATSFAASGEVDLIIIDSVASLTPQAEIDGDMDQQQMGLQARMMSKFCRKVTPVLKKNRCTLLCINQIRENIGSYGNPECVVPRTKVQFKTRDMFREKDYGTQTMADLFEAAGVDWKMMKPDTYYTLREGAIKIKTQASGKVGYQDVVKLVRKKDSPTITLYTGSKASGNKQARLKASPAHKVWARVNGKEDWKSLEELYKLYNTGSYIYVMKCDDEFEEHKGPSWVLVTELVKDSSLSPILDIEVKNLHTYFAGSVFSHNTTTGGKALKFYASIRLELRRKEYIMDKDTPIGIVIAAKTVKNKTAPPMSKYLLQMYFDKSFDASSEWVTHAIDLGIVKMGGAGFAELPDGTKIRGKQNVVDYYMDPAHKDAYDKLKAECSKYLYKKAIRVSVDTPEEIAEREALEREADAEEN